MKICLQSCDSLSTTSDFSIQFIPKIVTKYQLAFDDKVCDSKKVTKWNYTNIIFKTRLVIVVVPALFSDMYYWGQKCLSVTSMDNPKRYRRQWTSNSDSFKPSQRRKNSLAAWEDLCSQAPTSIIDTPSACMPGVVCTHVKPALPTILISWLDANLLQAPMSIKYYFEMHQRVDDDLVLFIA